MSEPNSISLAGSQARSLTAAQSGTADPRAAIARAARATGVDFNYLLAQARLESGMDPSARARTSSATGLYQFTSGTWLQTLDRHGARHGLGWAEAAISGGRVADPAMRGPIMALRLDADASALMAAELASDNRDALAQRLGREPDAAELYLAHFLGIGGAGQFLAALNADPAQSAAALLPRAAAANRPIFYGPGGAARSVGQVMDLMRAKVAGAMEGGSPAMEGNEGWGGAPWQNFAASPLPGRAPLAEGTAHPAAPARPSMADTLRDSFGLAHDGGDGGGNGGGAPAFVRAAYGKLRGLGL